VALLQGRGPGISGPIRETPQLTHRGLRELLCTTSFQSYNHVFDGQRWSSRGDCLFEKNSHDQRRIDFEVIQEELIRGLSFDPKWLKRFIWEVLEVGGDDDVGPTQQGG